ncbi:MAG: hypothetical protein COU35_02170 [Candidatus Magasanikbacteria bacterium CG10_big_fil_rev_8_21_14_0_10_47_10]|uniref:Uncharacterized protein n=1 Tax=Candidatus Magasanikbacteria bacterium CG10_big_fil_rev_8_21_14_0_10_47_10 TaxID=1974652 RepID=A0A2H0TQU3_9BACT|nr:MAG: hypothetical protein COU35_02170 [Candidatus Magasanikbacteria bacterium CG10_big_fil_rev_8_21_14_0_10_47_10]
MKDKIFKKELKSLICFFASKEMQEDALLGNNGDMLCPSEFREWFDDLNVSEEKFSSDEWKIVKEVLFVFYDLFDSYKLTNFDSNPKKLLAFRPWLNFRKKCQEALVLLDKIEVDDVCPSMSAIS